MHPIPDALSLAQTLIRIDTVNPPGNEEACADLLQPMLEQAGFCVDSHMHAPSRVSLVARVGNRNATSRLCFVGHLDTVPLGRRAWTHPPFGADIVDGRLYGRGACDMKSGVAAFVCASLRRATCLPPDAELVLLLVAGEETGCEGSQYLVSQGLQLGDLRGVIVAEPTDNVPLVGHKGALWLRAAVRGIAAHGAAPEAGVNAIYQAIEVIGRLRHFCSHRAAHPVLGQPTLNIGTLHSGENVNSVPDWAEIGIDMRTTPDMDHGELCDQLNELLRPHLHDLTVGTSMPSVYTPVDDPWVQQVFAIVDRETGRSHGARTASYFTDASALSPVFAGAPTLILGPGQIAQMHQIDEYCEIDSIRCAERIFLAIIDDTLGVPRSSTEMAAEAIAMPVGTETAAVQPRHGIA